jgi:hypothetical protein
MVFSQVFLLSMHFLLLFVRGKGVFTSKYSVIRERTTYLQRYFQAKRKCKQWQAPSHFQLLLYKSQVQENHRGLEKSLVEELLLVTVPFLVFSVRKRRVHRLRYYII